MVKASTLNLVTADSHPATTPAFTIVLRPSQSHLVSDREA